MNRSLGWLWLALCAPTVWAAPPSGLDAVTEAMWTSAEQAEARRDYTRAAAGFASVLRATERPEAAVALGRVYEAANRPGDAERAYRQAGGDRDAMVALIHLLRREDRASEALRLLRPLSSAHAGDAEIVWLDVVLSADRDVDQARALLEVWLGFSGSDPLDPRDAEEAAIRVYEALKEADRLDDAAAVLQRVIAEVPDAAEVLDRVNDRALMEARALQLAQADARPLTGIQRERLAEAARALDEGALDRARDLLDALAVQAQNSPEVLGLRSQVHRRAGRHAEAERDLRLAEALDPLDPRWPVGQGEVLDEAYGNRFDDEAVQAFDRGLGLDPGRADVWLRKARAELRLAARGEEGRRVAARVSLQRAAALDPGGEVGGQARALLTDLDRERLPLPEPTRARGCPETIDDGACRAYHLALTYHRRGAPADPERERPSDAELALAEVAVAREAEPEWVGALNLEATILRARAEQRDSAADQERSLALFRESLDLDPNQPDIWVYLGKVKDRAGDRGGALAAWQRAIALPGGGGAAAHVYLAEEAAKNWDFMEARTHLDAYAAAPATAAVQDSLNDRADAVAGQVSAVERGVVGGGVALGAAALAVPAVWLWTRRRRATVDDLLRRDPGSWREVARVASALRHEVLKHHTSVLEAVADALDEGDDELAAWVAGRLEGPDGPVARGQAYLRELEELGRRAGVPLDLRTKDPVFSPVAQGLERLGRVARPMARGARRIVPELRAISALLHDQAYPALGKLVRRICVIELDGPTVQRCWERVGDEPAFRDVALPEMTVDGPTEAVHLRVWRDELELILVNLLRNAAQAQLDQASGALRVHIGVEEDPITFLERVAIRVADQAPRTVSTAMIRGRYIERGLGLTVDVISRNGGSIHVEDEPGWAKAVVVRLPRVEVAEEDP